MKVPDQDIINAVWNEQLAQMCSHFVTRYIGGTYGLSMPESCEAFHIYIGSTQRNNLEVELSHGYLLKKIRKLIEDGKLHLHSNYASGSFYYGVNRDKQFNCAIQMIRDYWSNLGLGDRHNTVCMSDFGKRLSTIQEDVLNKYGRLILGIN